MSMSSAVDSSSSNGASCHFRDGHGTLKADRDLSASNGEVHQPRSTTEQNGHSGLSETERGRKDRERTLRFRVENSGIWSLFLVPLCLYLADRRFQHQATPAVIIISYNSILMFFLFKSSRGGATLARDLQNLLPINWIIGLLSIVYGWAGQAKDSDWTTVCEYVLFSGLNFSFPYVFLNLVKYYPRSFTFGEAIIITSAFTYNFWATIHNVLQSSFGGLHSFPDSVLLTLFQQLGFIAAICIARAILMFMKWQKVCFLQDVYFICTEVAFGAFCGKLTQPLEDVQFLVVWFFTYLLGVSSHVLFIGFWCLCLVVSVGFVYLYAGAETSTIHRKFFHIVMCIVYFPAILYDLNFMFICSVAVLYGFVVLEALRVLKFEFRGWKIGAFIDAYVQSFRDDRDSGPLLLTPIYLLVGVSAPIWMTGLDDNAISRSPEVMAGAVTGVLSVGLGDTFASVVGSTYGQTKLPGSRKTLEGLLSSMSVQILAVLLLCWGGLMPYSTVSLVALCASCIVNSVVEAFTKQIDNLVVPLVAFVTVHTLIYLSNYFFR